MSIIPSTCYTLNPTAKTITFLTPYDSISAEEIVSIRNLSKQIEIYNSSDPRKHTSMLEPSTPNFDINIVNGVLTYVVDAIMSTTDKLQITIDSPDGTNWITILDGGSATSVNPVILDGGSA